MENTFVKFKDIEGEATEKNHKKWLPVKTISWNVERTVDMADLGSKQRGFANAQFGKITCSAELSAASPKICTYVASGKVDGEVIIEMCRAGDDPSVGMETYLTFKLKDCQIDSYSVSGGEEQIPEEEFTLAYRGIEISYKPSDEGSGNLGAPKVFKWNLMTGDVS